MFTNKFKEIPLHLQMEKYLQSSFFLDFQSEEIQFFVKDIDKTSEKTKIATELYYKIRDAFIYDPYHLDLRFDALKSSVIASKKRAWCVEKSILLASCLRNFQIPSRLGFAIVTNHLGVEKLTKYLRKPEIVFHGYVEVFLNDKWVKCTPAFDKRICKLSGVSPLNWNGKDDSMFQEYEGTTKFMEYIHYYGEFDDVPIQLMNDEMKKHYPHLFETAYNSKEFSFLHL
jgi:transglutaminase-like putative cysteine protease